MPSWSTWDYNQFLVRKGLQHVQPGGPAVSAFFKSLHSNKWPHIPSPFPWISDIRILACEKDLLIQIENIGSIVGQWLFSTFVPQPSEIARKFLTGKTKKGYFGLPLEFAPLDILWQSGDATKILATIAGPLAEGLYFLWLQQSAITALQSAQMIGLTFFGCPDGNDETLVAEGLGTTFIGSNTGTIDLWQVVQDPHGRYNSPGATMTTHGHWANTAMHGFIHAASEDISSMDIVAYAGAKELGRTTLGHLAPGTITPFAVFGSGATAALDLIEVKFTKHVISSGASGASYIGTRWIVNTNPANPWQPYNFLPKQPNPCAAPDQPRLLWHGNSVP